VRNEGRAVSTVKSFAIGNGDMYYIQHGSSNFSIIDCSLPDDRVGSILAELKTQSKGKAITRFISTHPDQDHISGLVELDDHLQLVNFYCVRNNAAKSSPTVDFEQYKRLRDGDHHYYVYKGCKRKWMNDDDDTNGSSGINFLWPVTDDPDFKSALADAASGMTPNNISPIFTYALEGGVKMIWMGDLETDFMEKILDKVKIPKVDVLFAPHHGRTSGKVPKDWLTIMDPQLVVIGEAPSEYLHYYTGYNVITQNSYGDIMFDNREHRTHIYVADAAYSVDFLLDEDKDHRDGLYYVGSLST